MIRELKKRYLNKGEVSLLDGLNVELEDYWFHLRASNTEPIIRLIVEAKTQSIAKSEMSRLKKEISEISPAA
jgi:phosphomannomutase